MADELEKKKISTNPFLYTDGSLVERDVLQMQGHSTDTSSTPVASEGGDECWERDGVSTEWDANTVQDPDHTPQVEVPRKVWTEARASSRIASSVDIDDGVGKLQTITGSYSEITERPLFKQGIVEGSEDDKEDDGNEEIDAVTPVYSDMDPVQAFLYQERLNAFIARDDSLGEIPDYGTDQDKEILGCVKVGQCSPDQAESALQGSGTVMRQGNIISFVADDLHSKIRLSSPGSKTMVSFPGSRSSTPSLLRTTLDPQVPPIDPTIINDIERHARHIATSVDTLIENMTGTLHSISALTVDCVETYRDAVCKTCDAVDANIKSMYQLMAKTEELSKSMKPIYKLQEQIKEVRRLLDMFENVIQSSGS